MKNHLIAIILCAAQCSIGAADDVLHKVWDYPSLEQICDTYGFKLVSVFPKRVEISATLDPGDGSKTYEIIKREFVLCDGLISLWNYSVTAGHVRSKDSAVYKCVVELSKARYSKSKKEMLFSKSVTGFLADHGLVIDRYSGNPTTSWRLESESKINNNRSRSIFLVPGVARITFVYGGTGKKVDKIEIERLSITR